MSNNEENETLSLVNDWYQILNVNDDASQDEIKQAYRSKLLEIHPDKQGDANGAAQAIESVKHAYRILSDETTRRQYDGQRQAKLTKGVNAGKVPIQLFEESTSREGDQIFRYPCRCGDLYIIEADELSNEVDFLVQCSGCTLHIHVTTDSE